MRKARVFVPGHSPDYYEEHEYEKTRFFCQDCGKRQVWEETGPYRDWDEDIRVCLACGTGAIEAQLRARRVTKTDLPSRDEYWAIRPPFPSSSFRGPMAEYYCRLILGRAAPELISSPVLFPKVGKRKGKTVKFKRVPTEFEEAIK